MNSQLQTAPIEDISPQRNAQRAWARRSVRERLGLMRRLRGTIADHADEFARTVDRAEGDTLVAEVLPLADAIRFLERDADRVLAPRRLGTGGRPLWLAGVDLSIRREPFGVVLVVGPANYPLFLPAIHAIQALVAGNAVIVKPGNGGSESMRMVRECLVAAGLEPDLFRLLGESPEEAKACIEAGVDKVVLTGSHETGKAVLSQLANHVTPATVELSGFDPVFVLPGADLDLVVRALRFGTRLNDGSTCIAPKRVFAVGSMAIQMRRVLLQAGIDLPVIATLTAEDALELAAESEYALGATVFGPYGAASALAREIRAGVVVVNDMIVPTADPRMPFGGRGASGFGVTRGAEGLLEMTTIKAIAVRRSRWLPHFGPRHAMDAALFAAFIALVHGSSIRRRLRAARRLVQAGMARRS